MNDKPAKTPKTSLKLKLSTPKNPVTESSKKASKTKGSTAKKGKKAIVADDDDATNQEVEEEPKLTPAQQKEKNQKMGLSQWPLL